MEQTSRIGIYLDREMASVVVLGTRQMHAIVLDQFEVSKDSDTEYSPSLGELIGKELQNRSVKVDEAFVALASVSYTQHNMHSAFTDARQIQSTIKFDIEEVVATDSSNLVITSCISDSGENGSDVTVFSADKNEISGLLDDLQANGIDPTVIEPDILCLARCISNNFILPDNSSSLFVVLSSTTCYMIYLAPDRSGPQLRSFMADPSQDFNKILTREIPITLASVNYNSENTSIFIAGSTDSINTSQLSERINGDVQCISLEKITHVEKSEVDIQTAQSAAAFGAAAPTPGKVKHSDFRLDFFPYLGRKVIIQKAMRVTCVAASIMFIAMIFQMHLIMKVPKTNTKDLYEKFSKSYAKVMSGSKPSSQTYSIRPSRQRLDSLYKKLKRSDQGAVSDDQAVISKLMFTLSAFNTAMSDGTDKISNSIELEIESIDILTKTIKVLGSTKDRDKTLALFEAIKKHPKLTVNNISLADDKTRDKFTATIDLKKNAK